LIIDYNADQSSLLGSALDNFEPASDEDLVMIRKATVQGIASVDLDPMAFPWRVEFESAIEAFGKNDTVGEIVRTKQCLTLRRCISISLRCVKELVFDMQLKTERYTF